jgi:hypothetical protein
MFATLASLVEERMKDDPELIHAVIHSLNQWLHKTWSFNFKDRIFTVPVISLPIVDLADPGHLRGRAHQAQRGGPGQDHGRQPGPAALGVTVHPLGQRAAERPADRGRQAAGRHPGHPQRGGRPPGQLADRRRR